MITFGPALCLFLACAHAEKGERASLQLSVAPFASGDLAKQALLELTLKNAGDAPVTMAAPDAAFVQLEVRDQRGQPVQCDVPTQPKPGQEGTRTLPPGGAVTFRVDLVSLCHFAMPGEYTLEARYAGAFGRRATRP